MVSDWVTVRIEDIAEINPEQLTTRTAADYSFDYIDISSVESPGQIAGMRRLTFGEAPSRARRLVQNEDILVSSVRPYLRGFAQVKDLAYNTVCSTGFTVLRAKSGVDSGFVYQFVLSDLFMKQIVPKMTGSNYPAVNASDIAEVELRVPPLPEQRKIAAILTSIDAAIGATKRIIDQAERIKRGLMQQLLTQGIGHTKFKKTEIGEIPEDWTVCPLGEVVKLQGGFAFKSSDFLDSGIPVLRISNIVNGRVNLSDAVFVNRDVAEAAADYYLQPNDIVIAMSGATTGKIGIVHEEDIPCLLNQRVGVFRITNLEALLQSYLKYVVQSEMFTAAVEMHAIGGAQPNISAKQIESVTVGLPPLAEQEEIASALDTLDNKVMCETERLKCLEDIKNGLMQVLLTGQVRVHLEEQDEALVVS